MTLAEHLRAVAHKVATELEAGAQHLETDALAVLRKLESLVGLPPAPVGLTAPGNTPNNNSAIIQDAAQDEALTGAPADAAPGPAAASVAQGTPPAGTPVPPAADAPTDGPAKA